MGHSCLDLLNSIGIINLLERKFSIPWPVYMRRRRRYIFQKQLYFSLGNGWSEGKLMADIQLVMKVCH